MFNLFNWHSKKYKLINNTIKRATLIEVDSLKLYFHFGTDILVIYDICKDIDVYLNSRHVRLNCYDGDCIWETCQKIRKKLEEEKRIKQHNELIELIKNL